jgi:O-antigen/teichoic acid export membrane protein
MSDKNENSVANTEGNAAVTSGALLKNTVFSILAKGIASGVPLIVSMYASRRLGVEGFGTAQYIIWLVSTVWLFLNFGLPVTLIRYIVLRTSEGKKESAEAMIGWSLVFNVGISGLSVLVFALTLRVSVAVWSGAFLLFIFTSFNSVLQSVTEGLMRYKQLFRASLVSGFIMLVSFFPLIHSYSLSGYIAVLTAGAMANLVVLFFGLRDFSFSLRHSIPFDIFSKDVRNFAFYTWLAAIISSFMWQRMELFFIKAYLTSADVAFFSVAVLLTAYVTQPIALLSSALLPYFSKESLGEDRNNAQATYFFLTKLMAWLTFFLCFFTAAHSSFIVRLVYGSAYKPAENVSAIVLAGSSFGTIAAVGSALLYGRGKSKFIATFGGIGALVAILAGIIVVPIYGVLGAGISRVGIQISMVIIGTYYIVKFLKFHFPFGGYLKSFFLAFVICFGIRLLHPVATIFQFIFNVCLALLFYIVGTIPFSIFDAEEVDAIKINVNKFFRRDSQ